MKQQVKWSYNGSTLKNETAPYVHLYLQRKMLADLGYTCDLNQLSSVEARCFHIIDSEIASLKKKDMEKNNRGR